jgi:hypothetical protein
MRHYFQLQFLRIKRHITDFGLPPVVGFVLAALLFVILSAFIFYRLKTWSDEIYTTLALGVLLQFSDGGRIDFLKTIFTPPQYRRVRLLENGIVALPFVIFLLIKSCFWQALIVVLGAAILAILRLNLQPNFGLPTPFGKLPYEFTTGFRKTFPVIVLAYFLTIMAILVGNFNLGVAAILLIYLNAMSFYSYVETDFYVWVHAFDAKSFLWYKAKIAGRNAALLSLPLALSLIVRFPADWSILPVAMLIGSLYLTVAVWGKYSDFPQNMGIPNGLLFSISVILPPIILFTLPYFFNKAFKKLSRIL